MKAIHALFLIGAAAALQIGQARADTCPDIPRSSSVYGYDGGSNTCTRFRTLEEAEAAIRSANGYGASELAFLIPNNFAQSPASRASLDYRAYGALDSGAPVLIQPAMTVDSNYTLYVKGWPLAAPHSSCQAQYSLCPGGVCKTVADLASLASCEFDNTWKVAATSSKPAYCWNSSGVGTTTSFTGPSVTGSGSSATHLYKPASSTAGWPSTLSITADTCGGVSNPPLAVAKAGTSLTWNIQLQNNITCPNGINYNGGATSTADACSATLAKVFVTGPSTTQTPSSPCNDPDGNPCQAGNGNKEVTESGFKYGAISLNLYYSSLRQTRPYAYIDRNWSHSFAKRVLTEWSTQNHVAGPEATPLASLARMFVQNEKAQMESFEQQPLGSGVFHSTSTVGHVLTYFPAQGGNDPFWTLSYQGGDYEVYDRAGRLVRAYHPDDPTKNLTLSYLGSPIPSGASVVGDSAHLAEPFWRLGQIVDGTGRSVSFEYSGVPFYWLNKIRADDGSTLLSFSYDAQQRLTKLTFVDTSFRTYSYNEAANVFIANGIPGAIPAGVIGYWLTGIIDERNVRYATYKYDNWGRVIDSWHGAAYAGRVSLTYGDDDSSATVKYPLGESKTITFAANQPYRQKAQEVDGAGQRNYSYDATTHRLTGFTDALLNETRIRYDANADHVTRRVEALGRPEQRRFETDWDGTSNRILERRVYSDPNDPTDTMTGTLETKTTFTYDTSGRVLTRKVTDPDPQGPRTRQWAYTYCTDTDVTNYATTGCSSAGLLRTVDGPRSDVTDVTKYAYYSSTDLSGCATSMGQCHYKNDLWKITNAALQVTQFLRYDTGGRVTKRQDANNVVTELEYYPRGWLKRRIVRGTDNLTETDDAITGFTYDAAGQLQNVTEPDGASLSYIYDDAHRLTDITDNYGNTIHYTLNAAGRRIQEDTKDPSGVIKRTMSRVYDTIGRQLAERNAALQATTLTYDANGNQDLVTDPLNHITDKDFDPLGRLAQTIQDADVPPGSKPDAIKARTVYSYDARDQLTNVNDPKTLNTSYAYNGFGEVKQLDSPDAGRTVFTFDDEGNILTKTDARGVLTTYTYDVLGRPLTVVYPDTSKNVTYTYDVASSDCLAGEQYSVGRRARMTDASGSTTYCYDLRGNLVRKVQRVGQRVMTFAYTYNLADRLMWSTFPSGYKYGYGRDSAGRVTSVYIGGGGSQSSPVVSSVEYYPFGPISKITYANGRTVTYTYDQNYWPRQVTSSAVDGIHLSYDEESTGTIRQIDEGSTTQYYTHDAINRLTRVEDTFHAPLRLYDYDATGDRISATLSGSQFVYNYPTDSHRWTGIGKIARQYDANGNYTGHFVTTRGGLGGNMTDSYALVYGDSNRLDSYKHSHSFAGVTTTDGMSYTYNGDGERVSGGWSQVQLDGTHSNGFYNGYGQDGEISDQTTWSCFLPNGELTPTCSETSREYVWLGDYLVEILDSASPTKYVESDALGTPRVVVDRIRNVSIWTWSATASEFGEAAPNEDPDGDGTPFRFDLRFPGQIAAEGGLSYNYFRDYDPSIGRYIESDPIGLDLDISTYAYAGSDPLAFVDPLGLGKGGRRNVQTEGLNKQSAIKDVLEALKDAIKNGQKERIKNLRALLKIIKRGGRMEIMPLDIEQLMEQLCSEGEVLACQTLCQLNPDYPGCGRDLVCR